MVAQDRSRETQSVAEKPAPFLRWAGSKRSQIDRLAEFWRPSFERYVEPFAGSARLFFAIRPQRALLADSNMELVNLFNVVASRHVAVHRKLLAEPRNRDRYEEIRRLKPDGMSPVDRAARFLYLNRNCFNGLYRTNAKGEFNVPMGTRLGSYPTAADLHRCALALRKAEVRAADFEETLSRVQRGDFVYLDPPYAKKSSRSFRAYGADLFNVKDIDRLGSALSRIDAVGAHFVVSYAYCREINHIMSDWNCRVVCVRRHVAGFASNRRTYREVMISNLRMPAVIGSAANRRATT